MKDIRKVDDLTPDASNANEGTERGRNMLEQSLGETGAGRSIVVDREGRVIVGNKTFGVAKALGLPIVVVKTDGKQLVVTQREDLDLERDETARKLAYYDNRTSEVGLSWDAQQIAADLEKGIDLSAMWREDELSQELKRAADETMGEVPEFKEYDENVADDVEYITCPECGYKWPK